MPDNPALAATPDDELTELTRLAGEFQSAMTNEDAPSRKAWVEAVVWAAEQLADAVPAVVARCRVAEAERDALRRAVGEWIPVAQRVPDDDRDVLILGDEGFRSDGNPWPLFYEVSRYRAGRTCTGMDGVVRPYPWDSFGVTHWRELPAPPPPEQPNP